MNKKKELAIVLGATGNMAFALGNVLIGLKKHNPALNADIIVFEQGISEKDKEIIQSIIPVEFISYRFPIKDALTGETVNKFSELTFSRFECFKMLSGYKKVLWLDIDILIQKPLDKLLNETSTGISLAAGDKKASDFTIEVKDIPKYNAGVMYIQDNLPGYNELADWCYDKTAEMAKYLKCADQGIINLMVKEHKLDVHLLHCQYNFNPIFGFSGKSCTILHTYCPQKFWNFWNYKEWNQNNKEWLKMGGSRYTGKRVNFIERYFQLKNLPNPFRRPRALFRALFIHRFVKKDERVPQNFTNDVEELIKTNDVKAKKLFEESKNKFSIPRSVQTNINSNFTLEKQYFHADYIFEIENAKVWGKDGIVITPDNKAINGVNIMYKHIAPFEKHDIFSRVRLPEIKELRGSVAVLTSLWPDFYYHWMMDILPKFYLLEKEGIQPDYYVINHQDKRFQNYTLEKLEIDKDRIVKTSKNMHLRAEKIILPAMPGFTGYDPLWAIEYIKNKFLPRNIQKNYPERIFISRKKAFSRRFYNQEEVDKVIKKYGFTEIFLEDMTIEEQALHFNRAKIIAGPHGGGMTNFIFCSPGTKVMEMFHPEVPINCYFNIANTLGLDYYYVLADAVKSKIKKNGVKYNNQDIIVDIDILEKTVEMALSDENSFSIRT